MTYGTDSLNNNMHQKSYKIRCYPTPTQQRQLTHHFGVARWTYNTSLHCIQDSWHWFNRSENWISCSRAITELKKDPDYAWLNDVSADVIIQSLRNLETAFDNFFKKQANYPKYKKKWAKQFCRFAFDKRHKGKVESWQNGDLVLPKLGRVKLRGPKLPEAMPSLITVSRDPSGRYFISFMVKEYIDPLPTTSNIIGIDMGVSSIITTSDGRKYNNPRHLKQYMRRLRIEQRRLARKKSAGKGERQSNRYIRQKQRVAKIHAKIADTRSDYLHKLSRDLINNHDLIAI